MLWSLGLAAVTGVLTVFVQRGTFMWRVIGTELCAAVACALILPCIPWIDREQTRTGGLLGMGGVVVEFLLALILIWELPRTLGGVNWEEELGLTMLVVGLSTIVAMPLLRLKHHIEHSIAARFGLIVVAVAAFVFLVATWCETLGNTSYSFIDDCAETGGALLVMGVIVALCLLGYRLPHGNETEPQVSARAVPGEPKSHSIVHGQSGWSELPRRRWRWIGVVCAICAFALWLGDIWRGLGSDLGFAMFTGLLAAGAVIAYAVACLLVPLKPEQLWFRGATIAAAAVTAGLIELWVLADRRLVPGLDESWIGRCMAAAGIVTGCGTMALAVLARLNRRVDIGTDDAPLTEIVVVCPRCRKKQSLQIGDATCGGCGLRISTRVEEPRCPTCDYLLFGLTSNRCPECGTEIAQATAS